MYNYMLTEKLAVDHLKQIDKKHKNVEDPKNYHAEIVSLQVNWTESKSLKFNLYVP